MPESGRKRNSKRSPRTTQGARKTPPSQPRPSTSPSTSPQARFSPNSHRHIIRERQDPNDRRQSTMNVDNFLQARGNKLPVPSEEQNVAPALASVAKKLKREMIKNKINEELFAREQKQTLSKLEKKGMVSRGNSGVAPRLQSTKNKLERTIIANKVSHLLESRPELDDLAARSILKKDNVAPTLQKKQIDLQRSLAKSNLFHALKYRPSIEELQERGVYVEDGDLSDSDDYQTYYNNDQRFDQNYEDGGHDGEGANYEAGDSRDAGQYHQTLEAPDQQYAVEEEDERDYAQPPRRSKNFHLTRILLKFVAGMGEAGEISAEQKGFLKDLIVDQDRTILAVAETFDAENDLGDFKDSLFRIAQRSG